MRRLVTVFLVGTVAGGLCDQIHIQTKTTVYENPDFFGQPWYIPLVFGTGITLAFIAAQRFAKKMWPNEGPKNGAIAAELAYFFVAYFASATFQHSRPLLTVMLYMTFALRILLAPNTKTMVTFAALCGIGGTTIEIVLSALGSFHYAHPDFFGVPYWLPALYCHAAPAGLSLARRYPLS